MSDTSQSGLLRRLYFTPLRDLLRGRITAAQDYRAALAAADLPAPIRQLIEQTVRRTRLWRSEKTEVVEELTAHFADGLERGQSVEQLIDAFGSVAAAARLIRRGKKRNRPLAWKVWRGVGWLTALLLILCAVAAGRFFMGQPLHGVDYVGEIQQASEQAPLEDRAWPLYRKGLLLSGLIHPSDDWVDSFDSRPGDKAWPTARSWVKQHAGALEIFRQASAKPALGFVVGPGGSFYNDPELYGPGRQYAMPDFVPADSLWAVCLPYLNNVRVISQALGADAILANEENDGPRCLADIEAIIGIADQLHRQKFAFSVQDMVAMGIRNLALAYTDDVVARGARSLSNDRLRRLAHRPANGDRTADLIDLTGERMSFADFLQHVYTDDGHGDGRITPAGIRLLRSAEYENRDPGIHVAETFRLGDWILWAPLPIVGISRREAVEKFNHLMDLAELQLNRPLREVDDFAADDEIEAMRKSALGNWRYKMLVDFAAIHVSRLQKAAERYFGHRDGVVVGIALELYHRRHGVYPSSLQSLVPDLLPAVPVDRITGDPVRYTIRDGIPIVYSVGADRKDDGGVPAVTDSDMQGLPDPAAEWNVPAGKAAHGDWILYPQSRFDN